MEIKQPTITSPVAFFIRKPALSEWFQKPMAIKKIPVQIRERSANCTRNRNREAFKWPCMTSTAYHIRNEIANTIDACTEISAKGFYKEKRAAIGKILRQLVLELSRRGSNPTLA